MACGSLRDSLYEALDNDNVELSSNTLLVLA